MASPESPENIDLPPTYESVKDMIAVSGGLEVMGCYVYEVLGPNVTADAIRSQIIIAAGLTEPLYDLPGLNGVMSAMPININGLGQRNPGKPYYEYSRIRVPYIRYHQKIGSMAVTTTADFDRPIQLDNGEVADKWESTGKRQPILRTIDLLFFPSTDPSEVENKVPQLIEATYLAVIKRRANRRSLKKSLSAGL
jgi:hypothetical protein